MKIKVVPLIRHFSVLPRRDSYSAGEEGWFGLDRTADRKGWEHLVRDRRAVILADAGAGKTFELMAQAERMQVAGKAAFFIRIEDIDADFDKAFEIGTTDAFTAWLAGAGDAWFFLDSVDEVRLEAPRAFEDALRAFADRVRDARHRAHIYISSRPYAWRPDLDGGLIDQLLPWSEPAVQLEDPDGAPSPKAQSPSGRRRNRVTDEQADESPLHIYRLAPLDRDDIKTFAGHRGTPDIKGLMEAIDRANLWNLAQRPFDLEDILATWRELQTLDDRLAVLQRGLRRQLSPPAGRLVTLNADKALDGARRLAFAALMTGEVNIRMPGGDPKSGGLDTSALLEGWTKPEITALLSRGVFNDPIYRAVRFRHREIRELLAAEWLDGLLKAGGRRQEVEDLIFRQQYGEPLIATRLRPVLPWLILFDDAIRTSVLAAEPEIAVEGGDPARLPLEDRRKLLTELVERLADDGIGFSGADNAAIARIAQPDLDADTAALIDLWSENDDVIFFLGRLAWQGRMSGCVTRLAAIAIRPDRGVYARIAATRAVAASGEDARRSLWRELIDSGAMTPRSIAEELLDGAEADSVTVDLVLQSIDCIEAPDRYGPSGLTLALQNLISRLPINHDKGPVQPLAVLAEGLNEILSRKPFIEHGAFEVSQAHRWLLSPAMHCVERLVAARAAAALQAPALAVMLKATIRRFWDQGEDRNRECKLPDLVPPWTELNDALFWAAVREQRRMKAAAGDVVRNDWDVTWMGHYWAFDEASFDRTLAWITDREDPDDRLVALHRVFRTYRDAGRPRGWLHRLKRTVEGDAALSDELANLRQRPKASPSMKRMNDTERRYTRRRAVKDSRNAAERTAWITALKTDPDRVRRGAPGKPGAMTWDHYHLLRSIEGDDFRTSRGEMTDWRALIPEFGEAVAEAFRDVAQRFWRDYEPSLRSEGANTMSVPVELTLAMSGLGIEAGQDGSGLNGLSETEARRAARYGVWELNGLPPWFQALAGVYPSVVEDLVWQELRWELENAPVEDSFHYMLHTVVYHAPWLHALLAPKLLAWLETHDLRRNDALAYGRQILIDGGTQADALATLASTKAASIATPAVQKPAWWALWVDSDPAVAVPAVEGMLDSMEAEAALAFAKSFAVSLFGGRREGGPRVGGLRDPADLKRLYILLHRHIRVADDIERANKGVYSPTQRDDAQDARNALFSRLADIPGEETYRALIELADEHPEPGYRGAMRRRARARAVFDGDVPAWSQAEVASFQRASRGQEAATGSH